MSSAICCSRDEEFRRESFIKNCISTSRTNTHRVKHSHPFLPLPSSLCASYRAKKKKKKSSPRENEAEMARAAPALTSFDLQMLRARIFLPTAHEIRSRMWSAAGVSRGELLHSEMSCICWGLAGLDAGGFSSFSHSFLLLLALFYCGVVFLKY